MEKMKVEQERKERYLAQEALKEKERKSLVQSVGQPPASSTPSLSHSSSISGVDHTSLHAASSQEDSLDQSLGTMTMSMSLSGTNLYEAAQLSGGSSIIENLQSQLKLREGERAQLEISSLERTCSSMAEEMVRLTNQNEEMEEEGDHHTESATSETQHHPPDVWRGGRGAETRPGGRQEHVQNPD